MTIRKGEPWGQPGALPNDGVVVDSDAAAAAVVGAALGQGHRPPPVGLVAGDLCRTLGGRGDRSRLHTGDAMALPCDVGEAVVDGEVRFFVAHLVVRRRGWLVGDVHAVMNAEHLGQWDVAPRSHPNDGRLDHLHVTMRPTDRVEAWRRLPTGTHVPHPDIEERRVREVEIAVPAGARVFVDGVDIGRAEVVAVRCLADAVTVHV